MRRGPHSPRKRERALLDASLLKNMADTHTGRLSTAAGIHHPLLPLQTWTNVSTDPESVKAAASASTPRAATPASAHPAWSSTQRTRGIAQVEPSARKGEAGLEQGKEPRQFPEPKQQREETQVPVTTGVCQGPASGSPPRTVPPRTRETAETSGLKLGSVNISQTSPLPHLSHSSRGSSHFWFLEGEPWSRAPEARTLGLEVQPL